MAISPIQLAELIKDVRNSFITIINIDMEIVPGAKYGDDEKKTASECVTNVVQSMDSLLNLLVNIPPTEQPAPEQTPAQDEPVPEAAPEATESAPTQ